MISNNTHYSSYKSIAFIVFTIKMTKLTSMNNQVFFRSIITMMCVKPYRGRETILTSFVTIIFDMEVFIYLSIFIVLNVWTTS